MLSLHLKMLGQKIETKYQNLDYGKIHIEKDFDDLWRKGMFQEIDETYLSQDVDVLKHDFFLMDHHNFQT